MQTGRLALTLGAALALAIGGAVVGPELPRAAAATTSVKVLDWNISGATTAFNDARFTAAVNAIRAHDPDIIALQEVHDNDNRAGGLDQVIALRSAFPGYDHVWARGDGNGFGGSAGNLLLSRYPILERFAAKLPNTATCPNTRDNSGVPGCPVNRSFGGMKINVNGLDIRAYTSHLSNGLSSATVALRAAQTDYVVDRLQSPPITSAFVFAGDLNHPPGDADRRKLGGIGLRDAWTESNDNTGSAGNTHLPGDGARIDYQWMSPGFDVTDIRTVTPPNVGSVAVSDHKLLVSTLTVRDPSQAGGASSSEGWAGARRAGTSARLWVCDDNPNTTGVLGYLENASTGANLLRIPDDRFGDQCQGALTSVPSTTPLRVTICRNQAGSPQACVRQVIS